MNSKEKGARGERELAEYMRKYGYIARRSQQYCGSNGDADVVGVDGIHIECKRTQKVSDEAFLKQAIADAKKGEVSVVMYRRNRERWKALLRLDEFMAIWNVLTDEQKLKVRDQIKFIRG